MVAKTELGAIETAYAINEVSVLRETRQAAKIKIMVDGVTRLEELICDGALVATPAGSTAYNLSAHGPILPLGAQLMAVTPISPFRPRRWRGALLPHTTRITFEVLEADKRPVSAVADYTEIMHPRMLGLTGSDEQVKVASQAYRTFYKAHDQDEDEFYLVDHSTLSYLVFPEKGFAEFFRRDESPERMAERIQCFLDAV